MYVHVHVAKLYSYLVYVYYAVVIGTFIHVQYIHLLLSCVMCVVYVYILYRVHVTT